MQRTFDLYKLAILAISMMTFAACSEMQMGSPGAKTVVTGAAGGDNAVNANSALVRCPKALGTMALLEEQDEDWYYVMRREYQLPHPARLLRLMAQQSHCFVVVERDVRGMRALSTERDLERSGEMRKGSGFGKGKMVAADYTLTPNVIISSSDTGGIGAAVGSALGNWGGGWGTAVGAVAGGVKFREASTMLTLVENRSGVQIAASEGSASKADIGILGGLFGGGVGVGLGGYEKTPEGKAIAAAFADAFNQMVMALNDYRAQEVKGGLGKGGTLSIGQ